MVAQMFTLVIVDPNDTVAIAVGCVLAGLIIIVMISYFVLRARANRRK